MLTGASNVLNTWSLAAGGAAHAVTDLSGVHVEFGEGTAQGVTVHAKLFGSLALVSLMVRKHFEDVSLFELANGVRVRNSGAVHLRNESVQFALQG
jgi:hypothetical protein